MRHHMVVSIDSIVDTHTDNKKTTTPNILQKGQQQQQTTTIPPPPRQLSCCKSKSMCLHTNVCVCRHITTHGRQTADEHNIGEHVTVEPVAFDSCWVLAIIARELYVCRLIPGNVAQHDEMSI
jgi:hypothetical protein